MITLQQKKQHLLWRAGFGPSTDDMTGLDKKTLEEVYASLVKSSSSKPNEINVAQRLFQFVGTGAGQTDMAQMRQKMMEPKSRRQFLSLSRQVLKNLNHAWMDQMVSSPGQLREKMSLFWHGHFASRDLNGIFQQKLLQDIRSNALGSFRDLLFEVSKSSSMLSFLNNVQNRKMHPNENFAREVMELFTMGRGNYTEQDIKEAARAFTGWSFQPNGDFAFRRDQHDTGSKTILGKKGNFTGEDVLDILLDQQQTANYITEKIYRFFVNEQPDQAKISWLAGRFYKNKYNIQKLLDDIFTSDWFYSEKNIGSNIKSPVQLLVGIRRLVPMDLKNTGAQFLVQSALGQILFMPPNVAGWAGGKNWIDGSTLMLRLKLPQLIMNNEMIVVNTKSDDDINMGMASNAQANADELSMNAAVDWARYVKQFEKMPQEILVQFLRAGIHQALGTEDSASIEKVADKSNREHYIRSVTVALMSTPEYQMC
ncbi:DUF1800 domain-containing protein [Pedobacter aquatilis]|uniref:DUF1800 domain-containing protein n=1 Tax=Pedobacter aquatilis TaxID=351343 RepID=UPI00293038B8|nr:DUF1800 domain-containing protein [Pedobacter aquatilis]